MQLVSYNKKYTKEVLALWNRTMSVDQLSQKQFYKKIILDDNFDPKYCLVALREDKVVGFVWSVKRKIPYGDLGLEENKGWIVAICVDEDYQGLGIGSSLIEKSLQQMKKDRVNKVIVGAYTPNYLFPGVDDDHYPKAFSFFKKLTFEKYGEAVSMERHLLTYDYSEEYLVLKEQILSKGYQLKPFTYSDTEELLSFLHEYFPGDWALNVRQAIIKDEASETILILRDNENEIVGYAQRAIDGNPNRFGPFGVKESLRGEGLGALLFNEMLHDMVLKNLTHVYFLWTGGTAQKFYEKNGMRVYRNYSLMLKDLS